MPTVVIDKSSPWRALARMLQGFDGPLAFAAFLLACAGLTTMYSVGHNFGTHFPDHARNMLLSGAIMFVVAQIPPRKLMAMAPFLYAVGVALLVAVAVFGITKKGAKRWVNVGVVIQPSEILKIAMPLMLSWWFDRREGRMRPADFAMAGALLAVPVGLIAKQPDLGTAILVLVAGASVMFFAGLSWKIIVPPIAIGIVAAGLLVAFEGKLCAEGAHWPLLRDYQQQRVCTLLDPSRDPLGKGFHIIQGMIAIGSGGVTGKGFMQGTQTHLEFVPERATDFVFASYSEEFGLVGDLLLISGFAFLLLRGLWIAATASTAFSRLLAGSVTMIFFTYAFVNMGMVSGILPVVGVPLPFISYGGTAMATLGMGLGILMSISRSKRLMQS